MVFVYPQLLLEDGTVIDCREGGVLGRHGDIGGERFAMEHVLSRQHVLFQIIDRNWFLTLLPNARNKTWLDGEEMIHGVSRPLHSEHDLQVGSLHFGVRLTEDAGEISWLGGYSPIDQHHWSGEDLAGFGDPMQGGGDMAAALESLRQLPGASLLLDDDLHLWWLSANASAELGPEVSVGQDFLTLLDVRDVPNVRRELEDMRSAGGEFALTVAGLDRPLRFTYHFPFFLGCEISSESRANGTGGRERLLSLLAGQAQSQAFQTGDVAKAITLATDEACRELACSRVTAWFADQADPDAIICRSARTSSGHDPAGSTVRMNYCPTFFDPLRKDTPVLAVSDASPMLAILREIGFSTSATRTLMAVAIRQGENFLGLIVHERSEATRDWSDSDQHFAICCASLCLLAMQTRRSAESLAELKEKETLLAGGLAEARKYVRRLLPDPMEHPLVRTEWYFEPSETLGGDAFGYHWLDDSRLAMYVLDVVGHGTGAALLAVSVINTLRGGQGVEDSEDPAAVLTAVNKRFQMEEQGMMTLTAWYGIFDNKKRTITYSSAGHPPALLLWPRHSGGGLDFRELGTDGLILGCMDDVEYTNGEVDMGNEESKLYLFTDGAFEIPLGPDRNWTFEEFIAAVRATRTMGSGETEYLYERARTLCVADALPDDYAMVRFKFSATNEVSSPL